MITPRFHHFSFSVKLQELVPEWSEKEEESMPPAMLNCLAVDEHYLMFQYGVKQDVDGVQIIILNSFEILCDPYCHCNERNFMLAKISGSPSSWDSEEPQRRYIGFEVNQTDLQ